MNATPAHARPGAVTSAAPSALAGPSAEDELPGLYLAQGLRVPVPVAAASLFIASLAAPRAPAALTLGWLAAVGLVLLLRWLVIRHATLRVDKPIAQRINAIACMSLLGGVVHGQSVLFWPYLGELERAVQSVFVLGLCAGAVATEFGHPRVFLAYMLPMLLPLSVTWALEFERVGGPWWQGAPGVLLLMFGLYGGLLLVLARDTWRLFRASFDGRRRLQDALGQAEAANSAKTRFLASASHDLRQPLHTLSLFGAALSMRPLDSRSQAIVQQMNQALQALGSQMDALLDISKLDAGVVVAQRLDLELDALLQRLHDEFLPAARAKDLALLLGPPLHARVCSDPLLLDRVLRNLLDNALKYTRQGSVSLSARVQGGHCEIEIADTGPGIAVHEQQRVFEEFYQLANAERDRRQGLGLGLSIVRRLAELMQLRLRMHSVPGEGTRFTLEVPLLPRLATAPAPAPVATPSLQGLRVLVIDDEEAVREGMRTLLEGLGCEVQCVTGTEAAEAAVRHQAPDVALADLRLRGSDNGLQAVQRLRQRWPGLPALLVSGDTAPERLREAHAAGLRLLHKPVVVDALVRAIHDEARGHRPAAVQHG